MEEEKKPNIFHHVLLAIARIIPMHGMGRFLGMMHLLARRSVMQDLNLYKAPIEAGSTDDPPDYRTPTGEGNDPKHIYTGVESSAFGRNMPPAASFDPFVGPAPQVIASKLLQRTGFKPAGDQLNVLAASWIQAQAHDWFGHIDSSEVETLDKGTPGCPLAKFSFKKTKRRPDGFFDNFRTHWWDASFVYGQTEQAVMEARTGKGGKLHMTNTPGVLPTNDEGIPIVGDMKNGWLGVGLLQEIFVREHNAVADAIVAAHPDLADQDDKVFNSARLVIAAIVAKIHTVDWTIELLKTDTLEAGMLTNWYGILRGLGLPSKGPPAPFSLVGQETDNHGVPYHLTEEFVSVYRLHPLLPDGLLTESDGFVPLLEVVGLKGDAKLKAHDGAPAEYWDSVVQYPCGNLQLFNYPTALRDLPPTDEQGVQLVDEPVDLAALDIYRDRERGIRRFNDFRRGLFMKPFKDIADLCGKDTAEYKAMCEVYGEDGIEQVDLQVGMLAEKKIEPGFALSETAFLIFLLMASRRLEADRFMNENFNKESYTDVGYEWVSSVKSMRDVLKRHFPKVDAKIPAGQSAFKPYRTWPEEYLKE